MRGEGGPYPPHVLDEVLGVPVGHVQADELEILHVVEDVRETLEVCVGRAAAGSWGEIRYSLLYTKKKERKKHTKKPKANKQITFTFTYFTLLSH